MASYTSTVTTEAQVSRLDQFSKHNSFLVQAAWSHSVSPTSWIRNIGKTLYFFIQMFFTASALMWPSGLTLAPGVFIPNLFIRTIYSTKKIFKNLYSFLVDCGQVPFSTGVAPAFPTFFLMYDLSRWSLPRLEQLILNCT